MSKELRYRAVCPVCEKAFDVRHGVRHPGAGFVMCEECARLVLKYSTQDIKDIQNLL